LMLLQEVHLVSQDLSVAGKRAGLDGERSGLFMEQIRIVKEMREHDSLSGRPIQLIRPRYCVWENVPGAFSSNEGKDFQAVLTEFVKVADPEAPDVPMPDRGGWPKCGFLYDALGRWSVAWRTHDAQYFGVPQRRKRICVLADFNGLSAGEILFDPQYERTTANGEPLSTVGYSGNVPEREIQAVSESMSGYLESCGTERERAARGVESGTDSAICLQGNGIDRSDTAGCNGAGWRGGAVTPLTQSTDQPCAYPINTMVATRDNEESRTTFGIGAADDPQFTLSAAHEHAVFSTSLNPWEIQQQRVQPRDGIAPTISAADKRYGAIQSLVLDNEVKSAGFSFGQSDKARSIGYQEEMSPTLRGGDGGNQKPVVMCKNPQDPQSKRVFDPQGVGPTLNSGTTEGMNIVPSVMCGNPWDSQSERVYHGDGAWHSLNANESGGQSRDAVLAFSQNQREEVRELGDCAGSVSAEMGTHQQTFVKAFSFDSMASNSMKSANPHSGCREVETAKTLDCFDPNPSKNQGGIAVLAVDCRNGVESEINGTLQSCAGRNCNSNSIVRTQDDSP